MYLFRFSGCVRRLRQRAVCELAASATTMQ